MDILKQIGNTPLIKLIADACDMADEESILISPVFGNITNIAETHDIEFRCGYLRRRRLGRRLPQTNRSCTDRRAAKDG